MAILPQGLENKLWSTADQLSANSELTYAEYNTPVLGLVFLRIALCDFQIAHEHRSEHH